MVERTALGRCFGFDSSEDGARLDMVGRHLVRDSNWLDAGCSSDGLDGQRIPGH